MDKSEKDGGQTVERDHDYIPLLKLADDNKGNGTESGETPDSLPSTAPEDDAHDGGLKLIPLDSSNGGDDSTDVEEQSSQDAEPPGRKLGLVPIDPGGDHSGAIGLMPLEKPEADSGDAANDREPGAESSVSLDDEAFDTDTLIGFAGFELRYVAFLVDWVLVVMGCGFFFKVFSIANPFICTCLMVILFWLYFAVLESSPLQATIGKLLFSIRVTDMEQRPISFSTANIRFWTKFASAFMGIGFIMINFNERKQGLHDIISNCLVYERMPEDARQYLGDDRPVQIANGSIRLITGCLLTSIPLLFFMLSVMIPSVTIDYIPALIIVIFFGLPGILLIKWGLPARKKHRLQAFLESH